MAGQSTFALKKTIFNIFTRKYGLHIQVDAQQYLLGILANESNPAEYLEKIISTYKKRFSDVQTVIVDAPTIKEVVSLIQTTAAMSTGFTPFHRDKEVEVVEMEVDSLEDSQIDTPSFMMDTTEDVIDITQHFHVIDGFSLPKLVYDQHTKTFQKSKVKKELMSVAKEKGMMFRERLLLIKQRLLRNETFSPSKHRDTSYVKLTSIKELIGHDGKDFVLLGMLTELEHGIIYLEDAEAHIELELEDATYEHGLFTDGVMVIVEGTYTLDHKFHVKELGLPPPETRVVTDALLEHVDFLGLDKPLVDERLLEIEEKAHRNISFVIMSNVYLDQPKTMDALKVLFETYRDQLVPLAIIMIGNFFSKPFSYTSSNATYYKDNFGALGDLLSDYPEMATHTHFVFVPGPRDPWGDDVLPQHPLPASFVSKLKKKLRKVTFTTNPCRIRYCTQDIVIFREDLLNHLQKRTLIPTNLHHDPIAINHLVHTIVDHGHMSPLPLSVKSVYWAYDNALSLYPLPHTLILADTCESYDILYEGTRCINPGNCLGTDFSYTVYYPATKTSEKRYIEVR